MSEQRRARGACFTLWSLVFLTTACAHTSNAPDNDEAPGIFLLGRDDVVEVSVYRDADLTRTVPVRPDGRISLPVVGEIVAAGLTPSELRDEVASRLAPWVQDPTVVSVIVREVRSARFFVVGEVARPGAYPIAGEVSALQALALAGGLGEFSDRDDLTVIRAGSGRRVTVAIHDLERGAAVVPVRAGDTLVVP